MGGRHAGKLIAGAAAVVALIGSGAASAAVPSADGTLHGCINNATGVLRVVDDAKAASLGQCITAGPSLLRETAVDWNQTGPVGPPGPPGPAGTHGHDAAPPRSRCSSPLDHVALPATAPGEASFRSIVSGAIDDEHFTIHAAVGSAVAEWLIWATTEGGCRLSITETKGTFSTDESAFK